MFVHDHFNFFCPLCITSLFFYILANKSGIIQIDSVSGIGAVDQDAAKTVMHTISQKQKQNYQTYEASDRLKIAKYFLLHGPRATARKFKKDFPKLNESTVRTFVKKYKKLKESNAVTSLTVEPRSRPVMLGEVDSKVRLYIHVFETEAEKLQELLLFQLPKHWPTTAMILA